MDHADTAALIKPRMIKDCTMGRGMACSSPKSGTWVTAVGWVAIAVLALLLLGVIASERVQACNYGNNGEVAGGCGNVTPPPPPNPGCNGGQCCSGNCCEDDCCPPSAGGGSPAGSSSGGGAAGGGASRGKPVALFSGSENMAIADMEVAGTYAIQLVRWYSSDSKYDSPLGYGWAFNLDKRLYKYADNSVIIRSGCGIRTKYLHVGGVYQSQHKGKQPTLIEKPNGSFELTTSSGQREIFDAQGRLTVKQDPRGNRIEFTYDTRGRLPLTGSSPFSLKPAEPMVVAYDYRVTKIEERLADGTLTGQSITFSYTDSSGRLQKIAANDGREVTYQHDLTSSAKNGNLLHVDGLADIDSIYEYNDPADSHNVTSIRHGSATDTPYVNEYYADTGKIKKQTYGTDTYEFVYSPLKTAATHKIYTPTGTLAASETTTYTFNGDGFPLIIEWVLSTGEKYKKVLIRNSASALVETETLAEWPVGATAYSDTRTIQYQYDTAGYKTQEQVTLASGEVITKSWSYLYGRIASEQVVSSADSSKIFRTEYTFYTDGDGRPTNIRERKRRRDDGSFQVTSFTYNSNGQVLTVTRPNGMVEQNTYTGEKLTLTQIEQGGTASPFLRKEFGYDAHGNLNSYKDAKNNLTTLTYDDRRRVVKIVNALGEEAHYRYTGNFLTEIEVGRTTIDGEGQVTQRIFTPQGWLQSVRRKKDDGGWLTVASYTSNSMGQPLTETSYRDGVASTNHYEYDALGRLTKQRDPASNETRYSYDALGNRIRMIDAKSRETIYTYDALDRLVRLEQKGVAPSAITLLSYDVAGNLLSVTDPEGKSTQYTYDALSRRTQVLQSLGQSVRYGYDDQDRIDYLINARGHKIDYVYEAWGGLSRVDYYPTETSTTLTKRIQYGYDNNGNILSVSDSTQAADPLYQFTYDALNRVDTTTPGYLPVTITLDNDYDRYGNRSLLVLNDGATATHSFTYNKLNQLSAISLPGSQTFGITYFADAGLIKQITYPSGITTAYQYVNNGLIQSITTTGTAGTLDQQTYTYDAVLNVDTQASTRDGGVHDYGYDGLDHLVQATRPSGYGLPDENYEYDRVGNREAPGNPNQYGYDDNHRIIQGPGLVYSYDDDGNQTARSDGASFGYDSENRLVSYGKGDTAATYVYDPFGRRIQKVVNGASTFSLWDETQLLAEYSSVGARQQRYAWLPADLNPIEVENAGGIYAAHRDHLQVARFLTNADQQIVWSVKLEAFGQGSINDDPDNDDQAVKYDVRFPGQQYDEESGLYYNYFRVYDPGLGRYITADPIGLDGGLNIYGYALQNPIYWVDPLGLTSIAACANPANAAQCAAAGITAGRASGVVNTGGLSLWCLLTGTCAANEAPEGGAATGGSCPEVPEGLVGVNPRDSSGKRKNTDAPEGETPEGLFGKLTGGTGRNSDPDSPSHVIGENGVRLRPGEGGKPPRIDIPARGNKPPETIHFK